MEFSSFELKDGDFKGEKMIGSIGDFDESEMKKKKKMRIIFLISVVLVVVIASVVLYLYLRPNYNKCKKGGNDKCLSCKKNSERCASCNPYFRLENGECLFIYSFEAIYKTRQTNDIVESTQLFNAEYLSDYQINKIQVDGNYSETYTNYYNFTYI